MVKRSRLLNKCYYIELDNMIKKMLFITITFCINLMKIVTYSIIIS